MRRSSDTDLMRVLVVYCHPVPESFCSAIKDTAIASLQRAGNEVRLLDLYAENFDPVMWCDERRNYNQMTARDHPLPDHASSLAWAEALVFVYPTWWYGLPALLKGWLERVWTPGVSFLITPGSGQIKPLMTHIRKLGVITTCGASRFWSNVVGHPGRQTLLRGMRSLFARRCRTLFLAHYLMDASTVQSREAFLDRVSRKLSSF